MARNAPVVTLNIVACRARGNLLQSVGCGVWIVLGGERSIGQRTSAIYIPSATFEKLARYLLNHNGRLPRVKQPK